MEDDLDLEDDCFSFKNLKKSDWILVLRIIVILTIWILIVFGYLIYTEINNAKEGCKELGGKYELKMLKHYCDGELIYEYSDGYWGEKDRYEITLP